jgi:catechol 2,3-dioxygenase-like lactoylglutathione lyase family enzyme
MKAPCVSLLAILAALPAMAQLAPPNAAGVRMGHVHFTVQDVDAQKRFWTEHMGGIEVHNGPLSLIQMPGVYIMFRKGEPSGPQAGAIVDHVSFTVHDLQDAMAQWKSEGVKLEQFNNPLQVYVVGPEGVRIEILQDRSVAKGLKFNHVHFFPEDPAAMQAWYAKTFGGVAAKRPMLTGPGTIDAADVPGAGLSFAKGKTALVSTKGRTLDHIGFDVSNLDEFCRNLEAQGTKLEAPIRKIPDSNVKVAFLLDPWGTYIELTENLAPGSK